MKLMEILWIPLLFFGLLSEMPNLHISQRKSYHSLESYMVLDLGAKIYFFLTSSRLVCQVLVVNTFSPFQYCAYLYKKQQLVQLQNRYASEMLDMVQK
jgi:hypothetical protein